MAAPRTAAHPIGERKTILARRRGRKPNRPVPELAADPPIVIVIPEADRAAFAALQLQATTPAPPRKKQESVAAATAVPDAPLLPDEAMAAEPTREEVAPEPATLSLFSLPEPARQYDH